MPTNSKRPNPTSKRSGSRKTTSTELAALRGFFGYDRGSSLLDSFELNSKQKTFSPDSSLDAEVHVFGTQVDNEHKAEELERKIFAKDIAPWQEALLAQRGFETLFIQARRGPVWIVRPKFQKASQAPVQAGAGSPSNYSLMRDRLGALWPSLRDTAALRRLGIFFHGCSDEDVMAGLLGLELASYRFTQITRLGRVSPSFKVVVFGASEAHRATALALGRSMNIARHLVNTDAAKLNPKSYSEAVLRWFHGRKDVSVEIWGPERLREEGMHLHAGVGQGAVEQSHMVHIKYRPSGKPRFKAPIAIVGKGVTFDTGGLDIKPASGMRLMKKDMGGSASVVGLANWLVESESDVSCDLYLALAENAVDKHAFHPGDVLTARNGLTVEIHNTDAEGRLVMADVFDVAQTQPEKPLALIDLATLTGAMRVAVGVDIAGFFSTSDRLAELAYIYGQQTGDPCWRMPLWESYRSQLKSNFADLANASDVGVGGAISAALFLQRFVRPGVPWLHFDLYCWTDRGAGALPDAGGNGQGIQLLATMIDGLTAKDFL